MVDWDFIVGTLIIVSLILICWAKVSKQTVKEVIVDITNMLKGGGEEIEEKAEEVVIYE